MEVVAEEGGDLEELLLSSRLELEHAGGAEAVEMVEQRDRSGGVAAHGHAFHAIAGGARRSWRRSAARRG